MGLESVPQCCMSYSTLLLFLKYYHMANGCLQPEKGGFSPVSGPKTVVTMPQRKML